MIRQTSFHHGRPSQNRPLPVDDQAITLETMRPLPNDNRSQTAATALNYFAYNFIKIHRTLRTSPAMAAGVTDRLWDVNDLVTLWEAYEQRRAERAA